MIVLGMAVRDMASDWNGIAASLYSLSPQPDLFVFTENNSTDGTLDRLREFRRRKVVVKWDLTGVPKVNRYIAPGVGKQIILTYARSMDSDYLIFIDSDTYILSKDLLPRLMDRSTDITGGMYARKFYMGKPAYICALYKDGQGYYLRHEPDIYGLDTTVACVGGGCVGLNKKILQDKRLNWYPISDNPEVADDFGFCTKATKLGYKVGLDTTVVTKHIYSPRKVRKKSWYNPKV